MNIPLDYNIIVGQLGKPLSYIGLANKQLIGTTPVVPPLILDYIDANIQSLHQLYVLFL